MVGSGYLNSTEYNSATDIEHWFIQNQQTKFPLKSQLRFIEFFFMTPIWNLQLKTQVIMFLKLWWHSKRDTWSTVIIRPLNIFRLCLHIRVRYKKKWNLSKCHQFRVSFFLCRHVKTIYVRLKKMCSFWKLKRRFSPLFIVFSEFFTFYEWSILKYL